MSHFSNDIIVDNITADVCDMTDMAVVAALNPTNLTKVSKFTGDKAHGANIIDFARTVLIDQMFHDTIGGAFPDGIT